MANNDKFNKDIPPTAPVIPWFGTKRAFSFPRIWDEILEEEERERWFGKTLPKQKDEFKYIRWSEQDLVNKGLIIKQGDFSNVYDSTKLAEDEAAANALAKKLSKKDTLIQDIKDMFSKTFKRNGK